jgi:hypothetical protein
MQVYVLISRRFSETNIKGVYATKPIARKAQADITQQLRANNDCVPNFEIHEFRVIDSNSSSF